MLYIFASILYAIVHDRRAHWYIKVFMILIESALLKLSGSKYQER